MLSFVIAAIALSTSAARAETAPGLDNLTHKSYVLPFLTDHVFESLPMVWDAADRVEFEVAPTPVAKREVLWRYYGMVANPAQPDTNVPMGYHRNPDGGWALTCFACHGGAVNGKPTFGAPNSRLDNGSFIEDVDKTRVALKQLENYDPAGLMPLFPPPPGNIFKGTNNSFNDTVALFSLRDADLNFLPVPGDVGPYQAIPMDTPPLWNVWKKKKLYLKGSGSVTARTIMQFTLGSFYPPELIKAMEPDFQQILDWILSLRGETAVEAYPGQIIPEVAARGRDLFNEVGCAKCHGTYGAGGSYPGKLIPITRIDTDSALIDLTTQKFVDYSNRSWFNDSGRGEGIYSMAKGYVAPPLDRIWATAPYLHNGSVPTLRDLLGKKPGARPAVWKAVDHDRTDLVAMGVQYEVFTGKTEELAAMSAHERRKYYDTTQLGASNRGHDVDKLVGGLPPDELDAIIEYLKTL